jgi:hypothetical protein
MLALATGVTLLAGCTSGKKHPTPGTSVEPTTTSTPGTSSEPPSDDARKALQALADAGLTAKYTAGYEMSTSEPDRTGTADVFLIPGSIRIDMKTGDTKVQYFSTERGSVSCAPDSVTNEPMCLVLSNPGEEVPEGLDPGVQRLFGSALEALADRQISVDVAAVGAGPTAPGVPASQCFAVSNPKVDGLTAGTYCFTETGVLTRAVFPRAQVTITRLGDGPASSDFDFPAPTIRIEG